MGTILDFSELLTRRLVSLHSSSQFLPVSEPKKRKCVKLIRKVYGVLGIKLWASWGVEFTYVLTLKAYLFLKNKYCRSVFIMNKPRTRAEGTDSRLAGGSAPGPWLHPSISFGCTTSQC